MMPDTEQRKIQIIQIVLELKSTSQRNAMLERNFLLGRGMRASGEAQEIVLYSFPLLRHFHELQRKIQIIQIVLELKSTSQRNAIRMSLLCIAYL